MELNDIATFALLFSLEIVLGIDNILLISILAGRLPVEQQNRARILGLSLAMLLRCVFVLGASAIVKLKEPVIWGLSYKSMILIGGGLFLLYKAVKEMHHVVEGDSHSQNESSAVATFGAVIAQILMIDLVFSIDSVITAVGLTSNLTVIFAAVLASFAIVLFFASQVSRFIERYPTLKILALSFLLSIGVTLFIEGMGYEVPKGYIYLPMGFALGVELLQLRYLANSKRVKV